MSKLVSVALCSFNGAKYLEQQLDSLLAQTYTNLEFVVSDDGSTDGTLDILHRYAERDSRFRLLKNAENVGLTANFERAFRHCRGEYIAPCDQDDVWLPNKIEKLIESMGNGSLAYCDSCFTDHAGTPLGSRLSDVVPTISTTDTIKFVFSNCVSGHAMLFKAEILQYVFPTPNVFYYDWWIAAVASAMGGVTFHNQPLVMYRQHDTNVTDAMHRRTQKPSAYVRGSALKYLRETEARLAAVARIPGAHQPLTRKLLQLWKARENQWLSLRLGWLMFRQRERFYCFMPMEKKTLRRMSVDFFRGIRTKRIKDFYGYADT